MKKLILLYLFCLCVGFSSLSEAGKALTIIPTTKQAVIFTFGGLQNAPTAKRAGTAIRQRLRRMLRHRQSILPHCAYGTARVGAISHHHGRRHRRRDHR